MFHISQTLPAQLREKNALPGRRLLGSAARGEHGSDSGYRVGPSVIALLSLALILLPACGEDPIAPGPDTGPVTAFIDGEAFIASSAAMTRVGFDVRVEASSSDGRSIVLQFPDLGGRNYLIGPGNPVSATVTIGGSTWTADESGGGGTITVTGIFPTRIEGSFNLTLVGGPNGSSLEVTQGRFLVGQ